MRVNVLPSLAALALVTKALVPAASSQQPAASRCSYITRLFVVVAAHHDRILARVFLTAAHHDSTALRLEGHVGICGKVYRQGAQRSRRGGEQPCARRTATGSLSGDGAHDVHAVPWSVSEVVPHPRPFLKSRGRLSRTFARAVGRTGQRRRLARGGYALLHAAIDASICENGVRGAFGVRVGRSRGTS